MKRTLLDMTQSILSALESDEVNSIDETTEARQVAEIIKNTYFNMSARYDLPEHAQLLHLDPSGDSSQPVLMYIPDGVGQIKSIEYSDTTESDPVWKWVHIIPMAEFLVMSSQLNSTESYVDTFNLSVTDAASGVSSTFNFRYRTDHQPTYCAIFEGSKVIFDSIDLTQDATLQSSKTRCMATLIPYFNLTNSFVPNLHDKQFPLLFNEAKALAFLEMKQMAHPKAEQEVRRQQTTIQRTKEATTWPTAFDQLPNFSRK